VVFYFWLVPVSCGLVLGLYRAAFHTDLRYQNLLASKAYLLSVAIILASFYAFQAHALRRITFLYLAILPIVFTLVRYLLNKLNLALQKKGLGIQNAVIVGYQEGDIELFKRFTGFPEVGYTVKAIVTKGGERKSRKGDTTALPRYGISDLTYLARTMSIDGAFVPSPNFITNGYSDLVEICKREQIKLKVLSPESDQLLHLARVHDIAGITLYSPPRTRIEFIRNLSKRLFDIVGSLALLALFSPVFVATSLAILIESGRPILFKQKRSSTMHGKKFYFYKFRSMIRGADELKEKLFAKNESDGALFKIKDDPRLTRVGKFIRKFSIDELPQLLNVLKGDMSLVGPRPLPVSDFEKVKESPDFWLAIKDREKVKPGMTGLWQISGRSDIGFREMVLLDLYYIENQSLLFDLEILFATIPVVLFGKGAY